MIILFLAMLGTGASTALVGWLLSSRQERFAGWLRTMPRSRIWAAIFFGIGVSWFLWKVWHLSVADFGAYRTPLFLLFATLGVSSFFAIPDFLPVRGIAILMLLSSNELLQTAYLAEPVWRLAMVSWLYLLILVSLWLGASPYRFRDAVSWLQAEASRSIMVGRLLSGIGAGIVVCAVPVLFY